MKVLIIGNPDSIFIKELVKNCLLPEHSVSLLRLSEGGSCDLYRAAGCEVITLKPSFLSKVPKIRAYAFNAMSRKVTRSGKYDIIHIMQVTPDALKLVDFGNIPDSSLILTYYGSDLLRTDDSMLLQQSSVLDRAAFVTVPSNLMNKRFHQVFGTKYDDKLRQLALETNALGKISQVLEREGSQAVRISKEHFGIDPGDITVAVGYNASPAQNHIPVIDALAAGGLAKRPGIILLLQLTYAAPSAGYLDEIEKALQKNGFRYKIFRGFMDDEENMRYRLACDIMIHAQPTDAFSASVREHLAADTLVINPDAIDYSEYKKAGVFYEEYDSVKDLPAIVLRHIESGAVRADNFDKMIALFPFDRYIKGWRALYDEAVISSSSGKDN